tara:strand:+ start:1102 stop:1830 length:729 start_codon:yes stop_codon:yes gene_type:complete
MIYDLIYNGLLLSTVYLGFDLLNKYKMSEIKTNEDIKIYFALKSMKFVKFYHCASRNVQNLVNKCVNNEEEEEEDTYKIVVVTKDETFKCLLSYGEEDFNIENVEILEECLKKDEEKVIYVSKYGNDDEKFLQLETEELKDDENILKLREKLENIENKRLFLNIQLTIDEKEYDLNNVVKKYSVVGNNILSMDFLKYILLDELGVELDNEDYKINIIDVNIVMFDINKNDSINITDEGYKII